MYSPPVELIDTHCHLFLEPLASRAAAALARAREAGVSTVVVPAFDLRSWTAVEEVGAQPGVRVALGLHPWVAAEELDPTLLRERLRRSRAVAVGEIGLDFAIEDADRPRQLQVLRTQLELAASVDLPVLLHCRGGFEELAVELAAFTPRLRGILHAFSRGPELGRRFLELGLHLALGGAITRSRATRARRSAASLPLDRLLLETDAPSIGMEGLEPEQVEPAHVARVAESLAQLRGETVERIGRSTTENARSLFRLD